MNNVYYNILLVCILVFLLYLGFIGAFMLNEITSERTTAQYKIEFIDSCNFDCCLNRYPYMYDEETIPKQFKNNTVDNRAPTFNLTGDWSITPT